jgi:hypothetical protein
LRLQNLPLLPRSQNVITEIPAFPRSGIFHNIAPKGADESPSPVRITFAHPPMVHVKLV